MAIAAYKRAKEAAKAATAPFEEQAKQAKDVLAWALDRLGTDSIESDAGRAYIQASYTRVTYDAKALDALCASDPQLRRILWPHRTEQQSGGHLVVR